MNHHQSQQVPRRYIVSPSSNAPRRLESRIRKHGLRIHTGGVSRLLIRSCFGVSSVIHNRYVQKTQYYRYCVLVGQAKKVCAQLVEADVMGIKRWPGYEEVRPLWRRVSGICLALNSAAHKAWMLIERYRRIQARRRAALECCRQKKRLVKRALIFALPAVEMAVLGLTLLRDMLVSDSYTAWRNLCVCLTYVAWIYCFRFICMYDK